MLHMECKSFFLEQEPPLPFPPVGGGAGVVFEKVKARRATMSSFFVVTTMNKGTSNGRVNGKEEE